VHSTSRCVELYLLLDSSTIRQEVGLDDEACIVVNDVGEVQMGGGGAVCIGADVVDESCKVTQVHVYDVVISLDQDICIPVSLVIGIVFVE